MPIDSEDQIVELFVQKMESEGDIDFAIIGKISMPYNLQVKQLQTAPCIHISYKL